MQKNSSLCLALIFILVNLTGCYPVVGGYRGPQYEWTKSDIIYLNTKEQTINFQDSLMKIFAIFIIQNNKAVLEEKTLAIESSNYQIPDSIFSGIKEKKTRIEVFSRSGTLYFINLKPKDYMKSTYVFGEPINPVQNFMEMRTEISNLRKKLN